VVSLRWRAAQADDPLAQMQMADVFEKLGKPHLPTSLQSCARQQNPGLEPRRWSCRAAPDRRAGVDRMPPDGHTGLRRHRQDSGDAIRYAAPEKSHRSGPYRAVFSVQNDGSPYGMQRWNAVTENAAAR
jgi:hypothetical protein